MWCALTPRSSTAIRAILLAAVGLTLVQGCRGDSGRERTATGVPAPRSAVVRFLDVADSTGIRYHWPKLPEPLTILDAFGCGCAFLDYDDDGWQDVLLVTEPFPRLYRNHSGKRFEDVTASTGLQKVRGRWKGCAVGDYDGDGRPDLVLTGYRSLALLRNTPAGWLDDTTAAGLARDDRWSSGAGFMHLDDDDRLDLVILHYVQFGPGVRTICEPKPGIKAGCPPQDYLPEYPDLWRNAGSGRFANVTKSSGMQAATGTAQVLAFADIDDDGDQDLYVGNDGAPADLMVNQGKMKFHNLSLESGVSSGSNGRPIAAMSADWADYDRDGLLDLFVTAFSDEASSLFQATGAGVYRHAGGDTGITEITRKSLGFGSRWVDLENDGWPDLAVANGHVYKRTAELYAGTTFRQPLMLLRNQEGRSFRDLIPEMSGPVAAPMLGRGLASGDWNNDGREDLLVVDYAGKPLLLTNETQSPNHWLTLELRTSRGMAYGTRITARSGDRRWVAQVSPASSYLSSSDPRIHLGLGPVARLDELTVSWPNGEAQVFPDVAGDRIIRITRGDRTPSTIGTKP